MTQPHAPATDLSQPRAHPFLACTPEELARLRAAASDEKAPGHAAVWQVIAQAEASLREPVSFPPRGGQHNQWYQCDKCQVALKTVDDTHHECPTCHAVYSGEPYDDVIMERQHYKNLARMSKAAWAWAITGREPFAADAKAILLGYARRYREYPYHTNDRRTDPARSPAGGHLFEQTLNEGYSLALEIAPAFDLIHDAPGTTDEDRKQIRDGLLRPMVDNIARNRAGKSNWQSWHNAGIFPAAVLLGDAAMARATIDDAANGFRQQMKVSVSDDGMWYENSWSYHAYTLSALVRHAEYARRCGIDLWSEPRFRKMFELPAQYTMADGSLPRFGDAVGRSNGASKEDLEAAYAVYHETALLPSLSASPTWTSVMAGRDTSTRPAAPPPLTSRAFPDAGHAILRGAGPAGLTAALTFGPYGGFHGHFDKLSFVLFGHGRELGVDPGRAASQAYRLPIHTHWYKATLSHNAVLVEGKPQAPAKGELLGFNAGHGSASVVAACTEAYPGVTHRRAMVLMDDYLLVIDDLASETEHRYDWVYHNRGTGVASDPLGPLDPLVPASLPGKEYVRFEGGGTTDKDAHVRFNDGEVTTHLVVAPGGATEARWGNGPCASVDERVPMVMLTRRGKRVMYAVAIEPVKGEAKPGVQAVALEAKDGVLTATISRATGTDTVTLSAKGSPTIARE
ncbi:MAG: alginate lyase family protein [Planctomycetota bacterium]|nr:alginate lyase family protein [Planctomycetota bacterium]